MAVNEPSAGCDVTQGEAGTALHGKSGVSPAMGGSIAASTGCYHETKVTRVNFEGEEKENGTINNASISCGCKTKVARVSFKDGVSHTTPRRSGLRGRMPFNSSKEEKHEDETDEVEEDYDDDSDQTSDDEHNHGGRKSKKAKK